MALVAFINASAQSGGCMANPLPLRFLFAAHSDIRGHVLGIVQHAIAMHLTHRGFTHKTGHTGAVTLIQRLGSALNLNVHFHILSLDEVYGDGFDITPEFRRVKAPNRRRPSRIRVARWLERQGPLEAVFVKEGVRSIMRPPALVLRRPAIPGPG